MTVALARRLVWEGVVTPEDVSTALQAHVTERIAFICALIRRDPGLAPRLEAELGHVRGASAPPIVPDAGLWRALPPGLPAMLLAVPVARDPVTGVVKVVAADPTDTQIASEVSHHLGAPVEVVSGPLRAVLDAVGLGPPRPEEQERRTTHTRTPAFGMSVVPSSSRPPRAPSVSPGAELRPSDHPIPLVRVSSEAPGPRTVKGVAPQASGASFASSVVVPPRAPGRVTVEPIIQLTRSKSLVPSPPSAAPGPRDPAESSGPSTVHGSMLPRTGSDPRASEDFGVSDFQNASTPEDVVSILVRGLALVARRVIVLAVRGKVFEGRDTNVEASRDAVRALVISGDRPSVALTAVQAGQYVGPMPQTLVHQELSRLLGGPSDDIAVGSVTVTGRAALIYVAAGLDTAYLTTRRGEELGQAASRALARIVRERKK